MIEFITHQNKSLLGLAELTVKNQLMVKNL